MGRRIRVEREISCRVGAPIVAIIAALVFPLLIEAQQTAPASQPTPRGPKEGFIAEGVPKMPDPPGPAPKRDLSGAWVGPQNIRVDPMPPMTPAGEAQFKTTKPYLRGAAVAAAGGGLPPSNDPFITCDPLGFPRNLYAHAVSSRGGMLFGTAPNRMIINYEQQRAWREIWLDGRQLPEKVDVKGAPDSRYYGYSVGHWENDNTFVIETTGVDERAWLDEAGHPRSSSAHVEERYTRVDQYNLELVATLDDPKFYTKPWTFMRAHFYWMKNQEFAETLCIPSEALEYRDTLARPSGIDADTSK
jgi:hypothetical protein